MWAHTQIHEYTCVLTHGHTQTHEHTYAFTHALIYGDTHMNT